MKKYLISAFFCLFGVVFASDLPVKGTDWADAPEKNWYVHYDEAVAAARRENKVIYVLRTGSDWCGWCKKLKADVLTSSKFKKMQKKNFIFLYLDFPSKKSFMPDEQKQHNTAVCGKLGMTGGYPTAKVINHDGTTLGKIGGYSPETKYISKLESILRAGKKLASAEKEPEGQDDPMPNNKGHRPVSAANTAKVKLAPSDKGEFMSVISMGTAKNGEGLIFPQSLQLKVGEYIYFRVRCMLPDRRPARVIISAPFGNSRQVYSKLGKGNCELVVGIAFSEPYRYKELELRLIPMDSNTPLETRTIPVDLNWFSGR